MFHILCRLQVSQNGEFTKHNGESLKNLKMKNFVLIGLLLVESFARFFFSDVNIQWRRQAYITWRFRMINGLLVLLFYDVQQQSKYSVLVITYLHLNSLVSNQNIYSLVQLYFNSFNITSIPRKIMLQILSPMHREYQIILVIFCWSSFRNFWEVIMMCLG